MAELYETEENRERIILVGVSLDEKGEPDSSEEDSMDELEELAETAGAKVVGRIIQNRESVNRATYIGKGKMEEVRELVEKTGADGVVCDDELTAVQIRNLEEVVKVKVVDRTVMILDIFAQRASTKEGKLQVELAQLRYRSSRLTGQGISLSRLGGGIGTRGPGEKKLEVDRRVIRERITRLRQELEQVKQNREVIRNQRNENPVPVISIVGYTNAGKSTLLNRLTNAGVLEEDKLFATLDPTTRSYTMESGQQVLFTDTVGFIRKLPHHLVDAFRSTLEEAKYADMILHVVDSSNKNVYTQMHTVYEVLGNLGIRDKMVITAFNKQDALNEEEVLKDFRADRCVKISAKEGTGLEELLNTIEEILKEQKILMEKVFAYEDAGKIQKIRKYGQLLEEEYREDGIYIKAYVPRELY